MRVPSPVLRTAAALVAAATLLTGGPASPAAGADGAPGSIGPGPTAAYAEAVGQLFLGRSPTTAELGHWSVLVHRDQRTLLTTALATSDEWAGTRIDDLYRQVFDRPADDAGRAHWVGEIRRGLRLEDVAARFWGSEELWQRVGATPGAYVDALYRALLGRAADDAGRRQWGEQLQSGRLDRIAVAAHFFASPESRDSRVVARYREVLGRDPDAGGLAHWRERLLQLGDVVLAAHLAASPEFHRRATGVLPGSVTTAPVGPGTAYPLAASWRPGCPVHPRDLVALEFRHWTDDGRTADGVVIVHGSVVAPVSFALRTMYGTAFPLTGARPVDDFGGDDDRSMEADNTSGFNCRTVAGTTTWSRHAFGTAVDINPRRNPFVTNGRVEPPSGTQFTDRSDVRPGMLVEGGPVVAAFDLVGWGWGGRWRSAKDYQHFSSDGR